MNNIRPIRDDADLQRALSRMSALWNAKSGTPEGDELDILAVLIEDYEAKHHAVPMGSPLEVIQARLEALGWTGRELARQMGLKSSGRVSEILSGKRPLTVDLVHRLSVVLDIAPGLLVGDPRPSKTSEIPFYLPSTLGREIWRQADAAGLRPEQWVARTLQAALAASNPSSSLPALETHRASPAPVVDAKVTRLELAA